MLQIVTVGRRFKNTEGDGEIRTEMASETETPIDIADPFARRLIVQYVDRRKADLELLRVALADGRFRDIQIAGHNMSGSGSAYGLDRVSQIGAGLESASKARSAAKITRLIDDLESFVQSIRVT